jgi:hypothetical protein
LWFFLHRVSVDLQPVKLVLHYRETQQHLYHNSEHYRTLRTRHNY